MKVLFK